MVKYNNVEHYSSVEVDAPVAGADVEDTDTEVLYKNRFFLFLLKIFKYSFIKI